MNNILKIKQYFIQPTKEGIYIILIKERPTDQDKSYLQYDGKDNALFLRTATETILLDYINPTVHENLLHSPYVQIAEVNTLSESITRSYQAPVQKVPFVAVV
jgi:hypothetical protein